MIKTTQKMACYMAAALSLVSISADSSVIENLTGSATNSQGQLTYSVPIDTPKSINSLAPQISVNYLQGSSKGLLGSGFHLSVSSAITRCAPTIMQNKMQGGITTDDTATYCLDGAQLVNTEGSEYKAFIENNTKLVAEGNKSSPDSWTVYDASGYIYSYLKTTSNVSEQNTVWHLSTKKDRFDNTITYHRKDNDALDYISYPGFKVQFAYQADSAGISVYSNGSLKSANDLVKEITIHNESVALYKYSFRYEYFSGFNALASERLKGISKCYLLSGNEIGECTKELIFDYEDLTGDFITDLPAQRTNIMSKDVIGNHSDINSINGMPSYFSVDIDNLNGSDLCFYSIHDKLVCNIAQGGGNYTTNENASASFGYTIDDFKFYSGLNFTDINKDSYVDLCIADDKGIQCGLNDGSGTFNSPKYITEKLNYTTGYQLVDVNRDGYVDICGALNNGSFQCFDNKTGTGSGFSLDAIITKSGNYSSDFLTELHEVGSSKIEKYKKISPVLLDVSGSQIPDLCYADNDKLTCNKGYYDTNNVLQLSSEAIVVTSVFEYVSDDVKNLPRPPGDYEKPTRYNDELTEKVNEFRIIKKKNELRALTFNYQDINSDGLVDVCYIAENTLKCHLNKEGSFTEAQFQTSFVRTLEGFDENTIKTFLASIHYIDINADGLKDLCFMKADSQFCGYNTGSSFTEFSSRLRITSDVAVITSRDKAFANYIRARFDEPTKFKFISGINVYGAPIYIEDLDGDGRTEFCTRTINGIDCHTNEQQSYYSLLTRVTDAFENQTKFQYKNAAQGDANPGDWHHVTEETTANFIKMTPSGLILTAMQVDTGLGEGGSEFETTTYDYYDYSFNPASGEASYRKIVQESDLGNKKQVTNFYLEDYLTGKTQSVIEYQTDKIISQSTNTYVAEGIDKVENIATRRDVRVTSNTTQQFNPVDELPIRSRTQTFSDFDSYGYAKTTVEIKVAGNETKKITTTVIFDHEEDLWILGRPKNQTVTHELTGATNQTKSMSFQYYPDTHALKKQIFEEGTDYQKEIDFVYYDNGLVKEEEITGLVDASNKQKRSASYTYNTIGQKLTATNALDQTVETEYHANCLAPEYEYDINERLIATHFYDTTCRKTKTEYISGDSKTYGLEWSSESVIKPSSSLFNNKVVAVATETTSSGQYKASYRDRLGRTLKEVATVAKTENSTTQSVVYYHYDNNGLLSARTLPIKSSSGSLLQAQWVATGYDEYLRPNSITGIAPDGNPYAKTLAYNGLTTSETFNNQTKSSIVGVLGKPLSKQEFGKTVTFTYTAMGELESTVQNDDESTKTTIKYDAYGFKKQQIDANTGTWNYKFNAFGELYWQKDAEANETTTTYDLAGRKTQQVTSEGSSNWDYFSTGNGIGQLDYHKSADGAKRSYVYDEKGRLSDEYLFVNNEEINRTHYSYDQFSRINNQEFNKNSADAEMKTPIKNNFDLAGRLSQVLMPANKLKSYDYQVIQDAYSASIQQIVQIDATLRSLTNKVRYHAERIAFYESKVQSYSNLMLSIQPDTTAIEEAITAHQELLDGYTNKYNDLIKVSEGYGGVSADEKYEYKGYDDVTGLHTFAYSECTKIVRRLIFTRCGNYEYGSFSISPSDFASLEAVCTIEGHPNRYPAHSPGGGDEPDHPSYRGTYIGYNAVQYMGEERYVISGTYEERDRGPDYDTRVWGTRTVLLTRYEHQFEICGPDGKYNLSSLMLILADRYARLAEIEQDEIDGLVAGKEAENNANVSVDKEVVKYKKTWVVIASSPIVMVPVDVPYDGVDTVTMERSQAIQYYTDRQTHYSALVANEQNLLEPVEEDLSIAEAEASRLKEAKEALLNNIKSFMSLQALEDGAAAQAALGDSDLVLWSALSYDVNGKLKDELFGNGLVTRRVIDSETSQISNIITETIGGSKLSNIDYEYTAEGNLDTKTDSVRNITESFGYLNGDNQLDTWTMSVNGTERFNRDYDYDALGNLKQKSANENTYVYGEASKPYRLTSFNGSSIAYDEKGFMKSANGKSYNWTSFGKPRSVSKGSNSVTFQYDAQNSRVVKHDSTGTTYYISPTYEQLHKTNGDIIHRYHIKNGYQAVATVERYEYAQAIAESEADTRPQDKVAYYSRDILGSGVLVTGSKGEVIANRHYSPYGELIDLTEESANSVFENDAAVSEFLAKHQQQVELAENELNTDAKLIGRILTVTNVKDQLKGFTSHEELTDVGLVHMNARLYDPEIGRFVSPDSIVPDAGNPLAYNRYSYVYNNPALATDPSGHDPLSITLAAMYFLGAQAYSDDQAHHIASTVLLSIATGGAASSGNAALVAGGTAIATSAAISGRIGAAEIRAGVFAYVSAEAAKFIGHGSSGGPISGDWQVVAVAHGVSQGTIGWVRNKNFWGGFVSGTVSHGVGHNIDGLGGNGASGFILRTGIVSASSAIVASATGGDAMQAAMTAALVHMFNVEMIDGKIDPSTIPEGASMCMEGDCYMERTGVENIGGVKEIPGPIHSKIIGNQESDFAKLGMDLSDAPHKVISLIGYAMAADRTSKTAYYRSWDQYQVQKQTYSYVYPNSPRANYSTFFQKNVHIGRRIDHEPYKIE